VVSLLGTKAATWQKRRIYFVLSSDGNHQRNSHRHLRLPNLPFHLKL
jgi:hypothetical protein